MIPNPISWTLSNWEYVRQVIGGLYGVESYECPLCGYKGAFTAAGLPVRFGACCPQCGSLERHRLFWAMEVRNGWLEGAETVLHFAAEPQLARLLGERVPKYQTADLVEKADLCLDIERIDLRDSSVDAVICFHVLEHVDDRRALGELYRILKPGGLLLAEVPICEGWDKTYENPDVVDPDDRTRHFGQHDHVRFYGRDFPERVEFAGFKVNGVAASPEDCLRYGLERGAKVFVCRKGAVAVSAGATAER